MIIYQYEGEIEILFNNSEEPVLWGIQIDMKQISPYIPAQLSGPPENCYPAEGPEWEVTGISLNHENEVVKIEDKAFLSFFGQVYYDKYMNLAYEEASASDEYR